MFEPDFIGPLTFFIVSAVIVKLILDYRLKRKLLDKGEIDKNITAVFFNRADYYAPSSLKWGLILIGLGLAVIIGSFFPYDYDRGEVTFSLMLLFAGIGLLVYYFVANNKMKEMQNKDKFNSPSPPNV